MCSPYAARTRILWLNDLVPVTDSDTSASVHDTAERNRELKALHLASSYLHRLRDPAVLAQDVITLLKDVVHHDYAAVYLVDGDSLKIFAVSDRGLGPGVLESDLAYLDSLHLRVGENITGWVAQHGRSLRLDNVMEDERYLDSQPGIVSELCVPMRSGAKVIGVINLESTRAAAYQETDQRVLEIVANQIAVAIENAQLVARVAETERLQLLADLTGGVAHDIGNLLVAILLRCELLRIGGNLTESQRAELQAIGELLDKTTAMSQSLLHVGLPRLRAGQSMCLNDHLRSKLPLIRVLGGDRMQVTVDLCAGEASVAATPGQIDQILINLAVNARAAIETEGKLLVRTRRTRFPAGQQAGSAGICLEVEDDGCGMTAEVREAAMQPLFTTRREGTGLGLATVARLVDELGGTIELESTESIGTLVRITLPIAANKAPETRGAVRVQEPRTAGS